MINGKLTAKEIVMKLQMLIDVGQLDPNSTLHAMDMERGVPIEISDVMYDRIWDKWVLE